MRKKEYQSKQLQGRVVLLFLLMALILNAVVVIIGYTTYTSSMNDSYGKISTGIAQVVASSVDANEVDSILEGTKEEEYQSLISITNDLIAKVPGVKQVYVYSMTREGMRVILDSGNPDVALNSLIEYDGVWQTNREDLLDGREIEPYIRENADGTIMTSLVPVNDSKGKNVCYVGCNLEMNSAYTDRKNFTIRLAILLFIPTLIVAFIAALYIQKKILNPIKRLDIYLRNYASGSGSNTDVKEQLESIAMEKGASNEILSLRDNTIKMIDDISEYSNAADKYKNNITKGIEAVIDVKNSNGERLEKYSDYVQVIMDKLRTNNKYKDLLTDDVYEDIIHYAPLYDMGELFVSDSIMKKQGKLSKEEYEEIKTHTISGRKVLDEIGDLVQKDKNNTILKEMTEFHHEHWDGTGYPMKLKGENIPLSARIMAVADVFNAIISKKSYKDGQSVEKAFSIIKDESGKQFDPDIVKAFLEERPKVEEIVKKYSNE